ncbi:hypothetical protein A5780_19145 [Nocardia sp. 852002-20019_SCH5090214]|uniref:hypothetical protein n=1 Tax=Nocardia sp. 852002-20019_SCH5090214 TaxID=1834087 RepID=UPI0007E9B794|nr:hypothetical protein [Nocardia sp. 852002-20019_SCH5090214]OBA62177.1 hypothetical protein A5780_19145 [Nocardia sp. 852002-20019_SCH5090214]
MGRFLANIADGPDIDDTPEFVPLTGTVTFTAGAPKVLVPNASPDPATYVQLPKYYECQLDEFGYLTWRGGRGVKLVAPNAQTNPTAWTWKATFDLYYEGEKVEMAPFSFELPEYIPGPDPAHPDVDSVGLVDLTEVSPVPASNGEAVVRGLSIVDVTLVGDDLVFVLDNGDHLDPVTVPQIAAATSAATAAASSATAASTYATEAQDAVDSFGLTVGTVTTGAPGDPASITITGGPNFTLDAVLPKGDTGNTGPAAPDATSSVKGIIQLTGDLAGTAASPTVPGLAGKAPVVHSHVAADISDSTTIGRNVLTASSQANARSAIGAGTSNLAIGTAAGTACEGNDSRLSDARTPTAAGQVYDIYYVHTTGGTARAVGGGNVAPQGIKLERNIRATQVRYRGNTAGASGSLVVELRKNGSTVTGTSKTIAVADQTAGGANATNTGTWDFDAGDVLLPYITGVDTTPGNGLVVEILAVTR